METNLSDVFEQAKQLVAEADRRVAEAERRRKEIEGQAKLAELVIRAEEAFDFTSREKLELDPRMDVHEDMAVIEFVVRSARAIFVLSPKDDVMWDLLVVEDGKHVSSVAEIVGGIKAEPNSRRLAAARVVASIATWVEKNRTARRAAPVQQQVQQPQVAPQQIIDALPNAQVTPAAAATIEEQLPVAPAATVEPRERRPYDRNNDNVRYAEAVVTKTAPVQPAAKAAPAPTPQRQSYGTFGKFFGH